MHRDSTGHVGFVIKKGKVVSVVKGSSAARNGLLTNHYVCEVNGQNVIGLKVGQRRLCPRATRAGGCWVVGGPMSVGTIRACFFILRLLRGVDKTVST